MRKFLSLSDIARSGDEKVKIAPMTPEEKREMGRIVEQAIRNAVQAWVSAAKVKIR